MKAKIMLLVIIILSLNASAEWKNFYPNINQVQMLTSSSGYAVGNHGLFLIYNGTNWSKINLGIDEDFYCLSFLTSKEGWIGTYSGKLYHYNNGITIQVYNTPKDPQNPYSINPIRKIKMFNNTLGYCITQSQIIKFNGNNWSLDYDTKSIMSINDIAINTKDDVWAVGEGKVIRYNGSSWQLYYIGNGPFNGIIFKNGKGYIVSAYDGCYYYDGYSWNKILGGSGKDIWADNLTNIWIVGEDGNIQHYNGNSWSTNYAPSAVKLKDFNSVSFSDTNNGWVVGEKMTIVSLKNNVAQVFSKMPTENDLWSVYFNNQNDGWAVGSSGTILHFNGTDWVSVISPTTKTLYSVWFTSSNNGWCVGDGGCILHYNGSVWQLFSSPSQKKLYSVHFSSSTNGWATGESVTLKFNGASWLINNDALGGNVIFTLDINNSWLGSRKQSGTNSLGSLYKYTSGTWFENTLSNDFNGIGTYNLYGIYFFDASRGFALGYNTNTTSSIDSKIWEFNSALGWKLNFGPIQSGLNAIHCTDQNNCWTVGSGAIYKWNGANWISQSSFDAYYTALYSVYMLSNTKGWIVGANGNIFYTEDGGNQVVTSSVDIKNETFPEKAIIYPNPANEFFTIDIDKKVNFIIYDVLGREFKRGVSENHSTIPISELQSGIYSVRMYDEIGHIKTSKLVKN